MYGSKADNLIKLRDAGINVPAFTIISARDDVEFSEKLTFVSEGSASLYAVRSSCNLEDGAGKDKALQRVNVFRQCEEVYGVPSSFG